MPMLDLQRRWSEAFRIRLGEARTSSRSKPVALDGRIRITSRSPEVIDAIAKHYGGVTSAWKEQHQLIFDGDSLKIVVLPGDACVGWWEQWAQRASMPVCTHRCDGTTNHQTGGPCSCPPIDERLKAKGDGVCRPTTRLWVMLPDVQVIGAGRLETRGRIAAETFPQSVMVLQEALNRGELIPATLRIVKVESSGRSFVVPRIEVVGVSLDQILTGAGTAGEPPRLPVAGPVEPQGTAVRLAVATSEPGGGRALEAPTAGPGSNDASHLNALLRHAMEVWQVSRPRELCDRVGEIVGRNIVSMAEITPADVEQVLGVPSAEKETPGRSVPGESS
jgi:Recombination directionality factor-like